ncbi:MAG TPA: Dabb family protein, partial [Acidimicrobiales bacterium]
AIDAERYRHGPDAGLNPASWDYVVVADFASADDYLTYRDHPDHRAPIRDLVEPIVAERASVQYEIAG